MHRDDERHRRFGARAAGDQRDQARASLFAHHMGASAGTRLARARTSSVDDIVIFDRTRGLGAFADVRRELSSRPFDLLIDLQVYLKAGIVTALSRAPVRLGFDRARAVM